MASLFDFGVASPQLDDAARGFSFGPGRPARHAHGPDARPTSFRVARTRECDEIRHVIATLGEERFAGRIAAEIVRTRDSQPLTRTSELAALVARCVRTREPGKHPATRTFQALRMHINDELAQISVVWNRRCAARPAAGWWRSASIRSKTGW
jgi:16S rRNA (cytosine1402-N4)-methyltransferase